MWRASDEPISAMSSVTTSRTPRMVLPAAVRPRTSCRRSSRVRFPRDDVETPRHFGDDRRGPGGIADDIGIQRAGNGRLLYDGPVIAGMQVVEQRPQPQGVLDDFAQILAGSNLAAAEPQAGIVQALRDQIFLERLFVLQILDRLPRDTL